MRPIAGLLAVVALLAATAAPAKPRPAAGADWAHNADPCTGWQGIAWGSSAQEARPRLLALLGSGGRLQERRVACSSAQWLATRGADTLTLDFYEDRLVLVLLQRPAGALPDDAFQALVDAVDAETPALKRLNSGHNQIWLGDCPGATRLRRTVNLNRLGGRSELVLSWEALLIQGDKVGERYQHCLAQQDQGMGD